MSPERVERDFRGHFVASDHCQWFRTTDVNGYRVSSVGEYLPPFRPSLFRDDRHSHDGFEEIGYGRLYETMVFKLGSRACACGCGVPLIDQWSEQDFEGYNTRDDAEAGHEAMVAKWANAQSEEAVQS